MHDSITARLDLLERSGRLTPLATQAATAMLEIAAAALATDLADDHGTMMATHLALACQRVVDRTEAAPPPPEVASELAPFTWERAIAGRMAEVAGSILAAPIPSGEVTYLIIHLAARRKGGD